MLQGEREHCRRFGGGVEVEMIIRFQLVRIPLNQMKVRVEHNNCSSLKK